MFTLLIVFLNMLATMPTNLIPPDEISSLTTESIDERIVGSKLVIVVEQLWCAVIWGCKACLLLLYSGLTSGLKQNMVVKGVAIYVGFTYVLMEILFFAAWCRPFYNYWSVPAANPQCSTYHDHLIANLIFNASSDVMMLCIPIPILLRAKLPLRKKIILCGVFSLGIFVILSAVLSKYYSFSKPYGFEWIYWYVREASVAVLVANIPHCWVLVRRIFNVSSFLSSSKTRSRARSYGFTNGYNRSAAAKSAMQSHASQVGVVETDVEDQRWYHMKSKPQHSAAQLSPSTSEENITSPSGSSRGRSSPDRDGANQVERPQPPLEIWQSVQFTVDRNSRYSTSDTAEGHEAASPAPIIGMR